MSQSEIIPTDEQNEISASARGADPVLVQAYAGTAKTTSIALASRGIHIPALALAFNKRIAEELKPRLATNWKVMTLNGLGHLAWIRALPAEISVKLDERKLGRITRSVSRENKIELSKDQWQQVRALVSAAMLAGLSPADEGEPFVQDREAVWDELVSDCWISEFDSAMMIDLGRQVLSESIKEARAGVISFDDQIYCPTILGGRWPRYPALALDEAQDLSPLNHRMVSLATRPDSKLLVVGDPKQAIYAWRGADGASMRTLQQQRSGWQQKRLTLSFRCPKVIVERQQWHAPGFRAAESNHSGRFETFWGCREGTPSLDDSWSFSRLRALAEGSIVVLCRNNAPLLRLAFALLRQHIAPHVLGRDIGANLAALARKIAGKSEVSTEILRGKISEWEQNESSREITAGREERLDSIADRAEALRAVLDGSEARDAADLLRAIEMLFSRDSGDVTLSTVHKAKGLEWDIVVHLDPWRVPSKRAWAAARAGDERALTQEWNLKYVAETRTKNILVEANLEDFR